LTKVCDFKCNNPTILTWLKLFAAQEWLQVNCPEIIEKEGPVAAKFTDLNPLDYHVEGAMLEEYYKLQPKTIAELKDVLQLIWNNLPQEPINKAITNFTKRLKACASQW
jgi:hypothetical protein